MVILLGENKASHILKSKDLKPSWFLGAEFPAA